MDVLSTILTIALIHLLAVMSPGPDFIMVLRNSLMYGRRTGLYAAIGLGLGILLHVTYCLLGVAIVISKSIIVFSIIKYIGAAYLIYIGISALRSRASERDPSIVAETHDLSRLQAIHSGFITNATNPKATLFFLSIFTLVISPETPLWAKMTMGAEMSLATMAWFALVALFVSHRVIRRHVERFQHYAEKVMGGVLIVFGLKLGTEHLK